MNILEFMKDHLLCLDGGMGTLLQANGLRPGELPERRNLTHPQVIQEIHQAYFRAGSHVVATNTFGANPLKFSHEELDRIIAAAVGNAKTARKNSSDREHKWIALDVGPSGRMLAPYGDLDFEDAVSAFAETIRLGVRYGVDLILIETMNDSYETKAALLAAKETCDLPVFVSNAYGEDGKLMTGASPAAMVALLEGMGADAIGINCSLGPNLLRPVAEEYLARASVPVLMKPNAGLPKVVKGATVFDIDADAFAAEMADLVQKGIRIVGGCCGTTPQHIEKTVAAIREIPPLPISQKRLTCISSYTHALTFGNQPILIGERINPTGKKRFREALKAQDMDYVLQEGLRQQEKGAQVLDVNVGLPDIDEVALLRRSVCDLQAIINLPLQIDTSNPRAMEAALRRYNGKALINSVNGKQESMDAVFPLAKKYGGTIIALTLDENGIPPTAEERCEIAKRIVAEAARYGIPPWDLIFDPLALTISADGSAAKETLRAIGMIRRDLGIHTSLGVSNVSFGLPSRDTINSTFFALALGQGLSAAIMNPDSIDMMKTYFAFRALNGQDENCADYIAFAPTIPAQDTQHTQGTSPASSPSSSTGSPLQLAIEKGRKERAAELTAAMLTQGTDPLALINEEIIPALNTVGEGFEKKTIYLPQLLMSAEASAAAFEQIKARAPERTASAKCPFVIATVKGDIHDIGKNIVKLLLENYGFDVTDLGKDVPPETIVETAVRLNAPLVGLSALMTTTVPAMEETIAALRQKAPWCKIVVGGAVLNREYADAIGADRYASDAMETVRYAEEIFQSLAL